MKIIHNQCIFLLDVPERSSQPGTFGHLAKQSISNTPREKIKGPKCGQCEEKRAMVVRKCMIFWSLFDRFCLQSH